MSKVYDFEKYKKMQVNKSNAQHKVLERKAYNKALNVGHYDSQKYYAKADYHASVIKLQNKHKLTKQEKKSLYNKKVKFYTPIES